jgi:hypothetical protein
MCESARSPKSAALVAIITVNNLRFAGWVKTDRDRNARGAFVISQWLAELQGNNRITTDRPWCGQLPDVIRSYLDEVHGGDKILKTVILISDGTLRELCSARKKHPYTLGRVLYACATVPASAPASVPAADPVCVEGPVT